jgi:hypothetical protein
MVLTLTALKHTCDHAYAQNQPNISPYTLHPVPKPRCDIYDLNTSTLHFLQPASSQLNHIIIVSSHINYIRVHAPM